MTSGEEQPQTWHHGIVASWWAEFNVGGPEIPYFRKSSTPYADASLWRHWLKEERQALPKPWRELGEGDRRRGSDGAEYELRSRIVELDPLSQCVTLEMRADRWRDGEHVAEEHVLRMSLCFTHELAAMLERAGFTEVSLKGDYTDEEPTSDTEFVVFRARKP